MPTLTSAPAVPGTSSLPPEVARERPVWSSQTAFVLAAAGSVIGLGDLWSLPDRMAAHGGGAFVLVYLAALMTIAAPLLAAEFLIGRRTRRNPIDALATLARRERRAGAWQLPAWIATGASLLVLSLYGVLAGWAVAYVGYAARGSITGDRTAAARLFSDLLSDPWAMLSWHLLFLAVAALIAGSGIRGGTERAARWLVPAMLVLLLGLVGYAALATGQSARALAFMFRPDFGALGTAGALDAIGRACFTLSLGTAAMLAYGSYVPAGACIPRAAIAVAALDGAVALLAGLAVIPFLLTLGIAPPEGPQLVFVALPTAFAAAPGGTVAAALFYLMLVLAALTSAIALLEPAVAFAQERRGMTRRAAAAGSAALAGIVGILALLAFNHLAEVRIAGYGVFAVLNGLTTRVLLPLAAGGTALFAARVLSRRVTREELGLCGRPYLVWWLLVRWTAPVVVAGAAVAALW